MQRKHLADTYVFPPALGARLRELRKMAGFSLVTLAHVMGRQPGFHQRLSRLETGRLRYPSIALIADYLRACRASFADIALHLDGYTARLPVRETPDRERVLAELARHGGPDATRLDRYDSKVASARQRSRKPPLATDSRVRAVGRQAALMLELREVDATVADEVNRIGVRPTMVACAAARQYGRLVWRALRRSEGAGDSVQGEKGKTGRPRKTRAQRLAEAEARYRQLDAMALPAKALRQLRERLARLFDEMHGPPGRDAAGKER